MLRHGDIHWYAIRIFRYKEKMKRGLVSDGVEIFVPTHKVPDKRSRKIKEVPVVSSLVFVRTSERKLIDFWYEHIDFVLFYREPGTNIPGIIPDAEMDIFRKVTSPLSEDARFFDDDRPEYHKGDEVVITEGQFKGMKGNIYRVGRDRKVLVSIKGVCSLLISNVDPRHLQKTESKEETK